MHLQRRAADRPASGIVAVAETHLWLRSRQSGPSAASGNARARNGFMPNTDLNDQRDKSHRLDIRLRSDEASLDVS